MLASDAAAVVAVPVLRRDRPEPAAFGNALSELYVAGHRVAWREWYTGGSGAVPPAVVDLPTYPFERQRYWLAPAGRQVDVSSAGLGVAGHPLLSATVRLAGDDLVVLTGRLSLSAQPWLADHVVLAVPRRCPVPRWWSWWYAPATRSVHRRQAT